MRNRRRPLQYPFGSCEMPPASRPTKSRRELRRSGYRGPGRGSTTTRPADGDRHVLTNPRRLNLMHPPRYQASLNGHRRTLRPRRPFHISKADAHPCARSSAWESHRHFFRADRRRSSRRSAGRPCPASVACRHARFATVRSLHQRRLVLTLWTGLYPGACDRHRHLDRAPPGHPERRRTYWSARRVHWERRRRPARSRSCQPTETRAIRRRSPRGTGRGLETQPPRRSTITRRTPGHVKPDAVPRWTSGVRHRPGPDPHRAAAGRSAHWLRGYLSSGCGAYWTGEPTVAATYRRCSTHSRRRQRCSGAGT